MGLLRAIGRAAPIVAAGVAAGVYLRRKALEPPPAPGLPAPRPEPAAAGHPEPEIVEPPLPEEELEEDEPATVEIAAVEEPEPHAVEAPPLEEPPVAAEIDVSAMEPGPQPSQAPAAESSPLEALAEEVASAERRHEPIDVTRVVDDLLVPGTPGGEPVLDAEVVDEDDEALAQAVRTALAERPGMLDGSVEIEVEAGRVILRGELGRPEAITAAERLAANVAGVREVQNLLRVPGTPPPLPAERRY